MTSLDFLGLNPTKLVAGFWGGLVYAFVFKETMAVEIVGSVIVGTFTANYLSDSIEKISQGMFGGGGTAFVVGLSAMALCRGIVSGAKSYWKVPPGENP
jgi:hypothetical protein